MERVMSSRKFLERLKGALLEKKEDLKSLYHNNTKWTDFIKGITEEMIEENCISREYYRIDSLKYEYTEFYQSYNETNHRKYFDDNHYLSTYNWKNLYAIEYENDSRNWTDELVKLAHIRSELKVIISYSEWGDGEDFYRNLIAEKMKFAIELLQACQKEAINDNWLIVFGPCGAKGKTEYDKNIVDYFVGYEMLHGKFVRIEE